MLFGGTVFNRAYFYKKLSEKRLQNTRRMNGEAEVSTFLTTVIFRRLIFRKIHISAMFPRTTLRSHYPLHGCGYYSYFMSKVFS